MNHSWGAPDKTYFLKNPQWIPPNSSGQWCFSPVDLYSPTPVKSSHCWSYCPWPCRLFSDYWRNFLIKHSSLKQQKNPILHFPDPSVQQTLIYFLSNEEISYHKHVKWNLRSITNQQSKCGSIGIIMGLIMGMAKPKQVDAQHQGESSHRESWTSHPRLKKVAAWVSDGWLCLKRLTSYTTQMALLYCTSQDVISLIYCEKHIIIISYIMPSEVFFRERNKIMLGSHFPTSLCCVSPLFPPHFITLKYLQRYKWLLFFSRCLRWFNLDLGGLSLEWKHLGCFKWCLQTSYHWKCCWWQPNQCLSTTGKTKKLS